MGASAVVQGREADLLNKGWNNRDGEKSGSGYIWEAKQTGFVNGVGCEK